VPSDVDGLLTAGGAALRSGNWPAARESFRSALDQHETAEALLGLAEALWWLGEIHDSAAYRERAYAEFRRRPDPAQAAECALVLCIHCRANLGNAAASAGWLARATRLVEESELDGMRGWLLLLRAGEDPDPLEGERLALEAREFARTTGDLDLELCALAEVGAALVKQGRVADGLAYLDEAMAGSLAGEGGSFDTVVYTSCNMISSCASCSEFERAVQWVRAADRFTERYGCPFLYAYCRTLYGSVLVATGDWSQAEAELATALEISRDSLPPLHALALATLAELRLAQGRIEEAERLVAGLDDQGPVAHVRTAIQLARGRPLLAAATAKRGLNAIRGDRLESAPLLESLGEAEISRGDSDAAAERGRELAELGAEFGCRAIQARGERLRGHALAADADARAGRRHLEAALQSFVALGMPLEAARTRLLIAESLRELEPELATTEARAALAAFEALGAGGCADATAAFLRGLGVKAARAGPKGIGTLTKREREVLALLGEGLSNPEIADRLYLSRKTVQHHVAHILSKLEVRSRTEAAAEAVRALDRESANK
jgi:DNA-binding NarL/FixJ family response regulator/predicted negative regulator of RcsB-dependent stress response